jgi:transcriptional regulator with PAS, ATPase and Fis domain
LRERKEDIPDIARSILQQMNVRLHRFISDIAPNVMQAFTDYGWPGNVRELMNIIESSMNFCHGSSLEQVDFSSFFNMEEERDGNVVENRSLQTKIASVEESYLRSVLNQFGGSRKDAAAYLKISKSTLYRMMKKFDLL